MDSELDLVGFAKVLDAAVDPDDVTAYVRSIVDSPNPWEVWPRLCDRMLALAPSPQRTRVLRLLLVTPTSATGHCLAQVLQALYAQGELDAGTAAAAFGHCRSLTPAVCGAEPQVTPECADAVRDMLDEHRWRLTDSADPTDWQGVTRDPPPRGSRFVLRGLDMWAGHRPGAEWLVEIFCAAELTPGDMSTLVDALAERAHAERREAFRRRYLVGDAEPLLEPLGWQSCLPMLRMLPHLTNPMADPEWRKDFRCDRAQILAASGPHTRDLLAAIEGGTSRLELVQAALGWNRAAVLKRFKSHSHQGIAAYGLLPLDEGETVLDRYLALRGSARHAAKFGPDRRMNHLKAVDVALDHLAQVAGYPDAGRLEWDLEARIAEQSTGEWTAGEYTVAVTLDGAEPLITVARNGKVLRSVPAAVRRETAYTEARTHQERLREQARRMRTGLVEGLVATAAPLELDALHRLLSLPAGAVMLPNLIWRDGSGTTGWLDPGGTLLVRLDGTRTPVVAPIHAAHPWHLYTAGTLSAWQAQVVQRRVRQPVKQAFRELYLLTPAERDAGEASGRYAGHAVSGPVAAKLLGARGWSTHGQYADAQLTRPAGTCTAGVRCEMEAGYVGGGRVVIGAVHFTRDGTPIRLADVEPVPFSETMRDLDLVVSVAGGGASAAGIASRADVLTALVEDLRLDRVTISGHVAIVRGSRATYRVHLGSGSIHVEPAGYLCVVPASFGETPHPRLFLPFADDDALTSVVLSKVLMLADDEHIADPSIIAQLPAGTHG